MQVHTHHPLRAQAMRPAHGPILKSVGLATALMLGSLLGIADMAHAATMPPAATAKAKAKVKTADSSTDAVLKFSQNGSDAMQGIRAARIDLFNGDPEAATQDLKAAQVSLLAAKAEAPTFVSTTRTQVMGQTVDTTHDKATADVVPLDGDLVLADNFQLSERHQPTLAKAREHLAKGDKKAAIDVLRQGDIDVSYSRQWMPIPSTEKLLDKAIALTAQKKYYEANLALKGIEDGLQTDVVSLAVPPAAASAS